MRTGPLALLQDTGRTGHAADGVGRSGAADRASAARANALLGNDSGAAVLECTLGGLQVRAETDLVVAVAGAPAPVEVDKEPVPHATRFDLRAGQTLRMRAPRTGLRTYLAVAGGFAVPAVLGSRSTDTLSGIGPPPVAAGDVLPVGASDEPPPSTVPDAEIPADGPVTLRVRFGPRDDWFTDPSALTTGEWTVSPRSNRVGLRLQRTDPDAPGLIRAVEGELPSEGMALGSVQIPPGGEPVLFLADHPLTGGYPVVAVVLDADVDRAAQLRPGQRLAFRAS
nr:biotin-dependent carboxyltransferase family protein [Nakamurella flavida]